MRNGRNEHLGAKKAEEHLAGSRHQRRAAQRGLVEEATAELRTKYSHLTISQARALVKRELRKQNKK